MATIEPEAVPPGESCANCTYSRADTDPTHKLLSCCRYPPSPMKDFQHYRGEWPMVLPTDWCGEWNS